MDQASTWPQDEPSAAKNSGRCVVSSAMRTLHRSAVLTLSSALLLLTSSTAQAQNASLTVYLKAGGSGAFASSASTATQVQVYAVASAAAKYNGSTNLYAPAIKTAAGGTFSQTVTGLYSPALAPGNTYQVQLNWTDNAAKQLLLGPVTLSPGTNNLGAGGLGSTTPIEVTNDPPPAAKNLTCYPDLPDRSTQLYVYWSGVLLGNAKDLDKTELHMSQTANFAPSASTLIATTPYGTDYRKVTGLKPQTDYYFCVRVLDRYGAYSDVCRTLACTTDKATAGGTDGGSGTPDGGGGVPSDGGASGGSDDAGTGDPGGGSGGDDAGEGPVIDGGSVPVGCGCSLQPVSPSGALGTLAPVLILLMRRLRRRTQHVDAGT